MRMYDIILKKRNGGELDESEINELVRGVTDKSIPDYQITAFLMAVFFRGMTARETAALTMAMARSGDMIDLSAINGVTVDKHSTGGVGDKTTLIIAPIAAALGGKAAKLSGRGLGHTGGTIDKLESIPGFKTEIEPEKFIKQVNEIGLCVAGQSGNLAPADKRLYALRDVTATVDCIPLIAASVMSKKIAAGSQNIVLDVKCGSGAFMKIPETARELARTMVDIGKSAGRNVTALITNMDAPLGNAVGNALEVKEAAAVLRGEVKNDLYELCVILAAHMAEYILKKPYNECVADVKKVIENGAAFEKLRETVTAQSGDASVLENTEKLPKARIIHEIRAEKSGYIVAMNAEEIGTAAMLLGAGRAKADDKIDYGAGIILRKKTGGSISENDVIAELHTNNADSLGEAEQRFINALHITEAPPEKLPLVYDVIK